MHMEQHATLIKDSSCRDIRRSNPLRFGIIGFGNIGRHHLQAAINSPTLMACAIADLYDINRKELPEEVTAYNHWEEMLNHPGLDAVSVCVPHHLHAPITLAALRAGKHVLVEKPLALTVTEGNYLIENAQQYDRVLMVELTHRFYPAIREACAFIRSGRIGEIYAVEDRIIEAANGQIQPWLKDKSLAGGGVALTNGIHMLDRIAAVTGQTLKFVSGQAGFSAGLGDIEDTAAMLLSLENGAPVQVLAVWPKGNAGCDDELTIYGTRGTLRVWAWRGWRFEPLDVDETPIEKKCSASDADMPSRIQTGVSSALQEFASAIHEHREPVPSAHAALISQKLIEQFYEYVQH